MTGISEIDEAFLGAVLNISNVEVDHKDGHRDGYENLKPENQKLEDIQPLSSVANKTKSYND
ncbi:MAG: hypothetical protein ACI9CD_000638 [Candidatus Deianiraeaceae bacterium]|jgi:hypothetical protein